LVLLCVQFAIENSRLVYLWDGYQIWATKARVLYHRGGLTQNLLSPHEPLLSAFPNCCDGTERVAAYPPAVPMLQALVAKLRGTFEWEAVKAIFPLFFVSLLVSAYSAARAFVPRGPALAASALLGLLPAVATHQSI